MAPSTIQFWLLFAAGYLIANTLCIVSQVGKPRKPISGSSAVLEVILSGLLIALLAVAAHSL